MDDIDKKILIALAKNARTTLTELSETIFLSTPAVRTRLQKLENCGYVKSYSTILNPEKFGKDCVCFCLVQLNDHCVSNDGAFTKFVEACPDILECHRITGQYEYMLKIVTKSIKSMEAIITRMRTEAGVNNTSTFAVLTTKKEDLSVCPE
ncbi:MAG: Lrp/AsnC family transcriptional regulator [Spirochaetaceae bacterium]|nr:Lrp/AsnC family transcriptional regulator [Spirochaetaceae bacterium]